MAVRRDWLASWPVHLLIVSIIFVDSQGVVDPIMWRSTATLPAVA